MRVSKLFWVLTQIWQGFMWGSNDGELYSRWFQMAVMSPVIRLHSTKSPMEQRLPWGFGTITMTMTMILAMTIIIILPSQCHYPYLRNHHHSNHDYSLPLPWPSQLPQKHQHCYHHHTNSMIRQGSAAFGAWCHETTQKIASIHIFWSMAFTFERVTTLTQPSTPWHFIKWHDMMQCPFGGWNVYLPWWARQCIFLSTAILFWIPIGGCTYCT